MRLSRYGKSGFPVAHSPSSVGENGVGPSTNGLAAASMYTVNRPSASNSTLRVPSAAMSGIQQLRGLADLMAVPSAR